MEINSEALKSQTTEALKALLDYSIKQRMYFTLGDTVGMISNQSTGNLISDINNDIESLKMYSNYSEIVRVLEDELGKRLEDIFIF